MRVYLDLPRVYLAKGLFVNTSLKVQTVLKAILAPARLVQSSCASAPRNTHGAGISSSLLFPNNLLSVFSIIADNTIFERGEP